MTRVQRLLVGSIVVAVASITLAIVRLATLDDGASTEPRASDSRARAGAGQAGARQVRSARVVVVAGAPKPRKARIRARVGDEVRLTVTSRGAEDEVFVRGYDISKEVAPDRPALLRFPAVREGSFDVILVVSGATIADLDVAPSDLSVAP